MDIVFDDEQFKLRYEAEAAKIGKLCGGPNGIIPFE